MIINTKVDETTPIIKDVLHNSNAMNKRSILWSSKQRKKTALKNKISSSEISFIDDRLTFLGPPIKKYFYIRSVMHSMQNLNGYNQNSTDWDVEKGTCYTQSLYAYGSCVCVPPTILKSANKLRHKFLLNKYLRTGNINRECHLWCFPSWFIYN